MTGRNCDLPCERQGELDKNHTLSVSEINILKFRYDFPVQTLCPDHYNDQFSKYPAWHKKCSDPCMRHKKPNTYRLSKISLDLALEVKSITEYRIIPGQKLCQHCLYHLREVISTNAEIVSDGDDDQPEVEQRQDDPADDEDNMFDSPQYDSPM